MDKKYGSYEETHKKLVEAMQEACTHDEFDDYKAPDIDLTFMNIDSEQAKRKENRINRFNKIAAVVVIALLATNLIAISNKTGQSYGDKGLLHRITETITGVVTDDDKPIAENEVVMEYLITNLDDIDKITTVFSELYIPQYMPKEFAFNELSMEVYNSGDIRVEYIFSNDKENIFISILYNEDSMQKIYSADSEQLLEFDDRFISIYKNVDEMTYVADVFMEDCMMDIRGINNKKEVLEIAKNMQKDSKAH